MHREVAVTEAYYLREQARATPTGRDRVRSRDSLFFSAAEAFLGCAKVAKKERRVYYRNAADCFECGGKLLEAANAFLEGEEFNLAAKLYRKLGMFDEAVQVVKMHEDMMNVDVVDGIIDVARLFYFREHKLQCVVLHTYSLLFFIIPSFFRKANALFVSYEEELEYLEDRYLDVARATLLESLGRTAEAAEIHLAEGRTLKAISLFLQDKENAYRGKECILQGLWENLSFGVTPEIASSNPDLPQLLKLAAQLDTALLDSSARDEVCPRRIMPSAITLMETCLKILMFQAIMSGEFARLQQLGENFSLAKKIVPAILCLDHAFVHLPRIQVMKGHEVATTLRAFMIYARHLRDMACHPDPCSDPSVQKLFGFRRSGENSFRVLSRTFLHREDQSILQPNNEIPGGNLAFEFRRSLSDRLWLRVSQENDICRRAQSLSPCLTFTVYGYCNRQECPHEHVPAAALNADRYNTRVRLHLQQILIYQTLHFMEPRSEQLLQQRWYYIINAKTNIHKEFAGIGLASFTKHGTRRSTFLEPRQI